MPRYPDFIIFGAAKSGTTTLFRYLRHHPQVFMPDDKEPEFYAFDKKFENDRDYYESLFAPAKDDQIVGEGSQTYGMWPHFPAAAERIATELPRVKLVYLMRDPVERAYSFYLQLVKMGQITRRDFRVRRTFEECVFPDRYPGRCSHEEFMGRLSNVFPDTPELLLDVGDYAMQIEHYLQFFSREQLHLMRFEDLVGDTASEVKRLFAFLGVDDTVGMPRLDEAKTNVSSEFFQTAAATQMMFRSQENPALRLISAIMPHFVRRGAKALLMSRAGRSKSAERSRPPAMLDATREWLEGYYTPRMARLEELTAIDTSIWLEKYSTKERAEPVSE